MSTIQEDADKRRIDKFKPKKEGDEDQEEPENDENAGDLAN